MAEVKVGAETVGRVRRSVFPGVGFAETIGLSALVVIAFVLMLFTYNKRLNLLDEGFILYASERVAKGQIPYKDFFTLLMPGTFCLHALLFKLFGVKIIVCRYAILVVGTAIPLLVYTAARRVLPWTYALLAGVLAAAWGTSYQWVIPTYSWYGSFFSLIVLNLALAAHKRGWSTKDATWVGLGLGLTVLFKQNFGVYSACAVVLYLFVSRFGHWRHLVGVVGVMAGVAALVNLPFVLWIAANGGIKDMITDAVLIPLGPFRNNMALPYPKLWPVFPSDGGLTGSSIATAARNLIPSIPLLYGLFLALWVGASIKKGQMWRTDSLFVTLFATFVFFAAFPRADLGHILFPMPAGFIVASMCFYYFARLLQRKAGIWRARVVVGLVGVVLATPMICGPLGDTQAWNSNCTYQLVGWAKAEGIKMPEWEATGTQQVLDAMDSYTAWEDQSFVIPWAAMFYFLSDRPNPTRYDLLIPGNYPEEAEDEMIKALDEKRPPLVVHGFVWDVDGKRFQDYLPRLHQYIRDHYRSDSWVGQYEFLVRAD